MLNATVRIAAVILVGFAAGGCDHRDNERASAGRDVSCGKSSAWLVDSVTARADVRARVGRDVFPDSSVQVMVVRAADRPVIAVGLNWQGPSAGALLLFQCDGRLLHSVETAYIDSLRQPEFGSRLPPIVAVYGGSAGATSYHSDGVTLFALRDSDLVTAWSGTTFERSETNPPVTMEKHAVVELNSGGYVERRIIARDHA